MLMRSRRLAAVPEKQPAGNGEGWLCWQREGSSDSVQYVRSAPPKQTDRMPGGSTSTNMTTGSSREAPTFRLNSSVQHTQTRMPVGDYIRPMVRAAVVALLERGVRGFDSLLLKTSPALLVGSTKLHLGDETASTGCGRLRCVPRCWWPRKTQQHVQLPTRKRTGSRTSPWRLSWLPSTRPRPSSSREPRRLRPILRP
jgi:hypothetical protein